MRLSAVVFLWNRVIDETDATLDSTPNSGGVAVACSVPNLMIVGKTRAVAVAVVGCAATAPVPTLRAGAVAALVCGRGYTAIVVVISGLANDRIKPSLSADFVVNRVEQFAASREQFDCVASPCSPWERFNESEVRKRRVAGGETRLS
ncbi:MAG TPA: hypothetical protein VFJ06_05960 [Halococcus sp.]|nr:hypothetical protein [Halococcus sp.]